MKEYEKESDGRKGKRKTKMRIIERKGRRMKGRRDN
jgi:hypothetical protein